MSAQVTKAIDHFSLKSIESVLAGFKMPKTDFDPNGTWKNTYRSYTLPFMIPVPHSRAGLVSIKRPPKGARRFLLEVDYVKILPDNCKQQITAKMQCSNDALASFSKWQFSSQIVSAQGEVFKDSALSKKGRAPKKSTGPYTCNWSLYEAVQRLGREPGPPMNFTLFDHFDQLKPGHSLKFRKRAVVQLGGEDVPLYAYEQLGEGVVPIIYWTSEQGRLLFVISGIESYVLTQELA